MVTFLAARLLPTPTRTAAPDEGDTEVRGPEELAVPTNLRVVSYDTISLSYLLWLCLSS